MSRAWYLAALVPIALAGLIATLAFLRLVDRIDAMPRMVVPGEHAFALPAGDHIVYAESRSHVDGVAYANESFAVQCSMSSDGAPVPLSSHGSRMTYALGGYAGNAIFDFTLDKPATVKLACETTDGKGVLAVGKSFALTIVVAVVPLVLGMLAAGAAFLIVFMKRRRYLALVAARDNT